MEKNNFIKFLDDKFLISERGGSIKGEFFGGLTTFLTISYIIFVPCYSSSAPVKAKSCFSLIPYTILPTFPQ